MIKINSIILFLISFYIIKKLFKTNDKNENDEKYNFNLKKIPEFKNNTYKNIYDESNHAEFKKEETNNLEKSSEKFNKDNKITFKNHQEKKIKFNYDSLSDSKNKKIKNFKDEKLLKNNIEKFDDSSIKDINDILISESTKHIKEKSDNIVEKHNFQKKDDLNEKILEKMNNKDYSKIEFNEFNENILERRTTSKPYKKQITASQLNKFKGKKLKDIYNEINKNDFKINKNTNIFGFKKL